MALVFGLMVTGCFLSEEDGFKNRTINLTPAGENAIFLTLQGATWKDPQDDFIDHENAVKQKNLQDNLLNLLKWEEQKGNLNKLDSTHIVSKFTLEKDNVIKIAFSPLPAFGSGYWGSGEITINELSSDDLTAALKLITENIDLTGAWTIGKNNPVTITIPEK